VRLCKATPRVVLIGLVFLVAFLFAPAAKADSFIDFACPTGQAPCTGTVTLSGANFSGSGIVLDASSSPAGGFPSDGGAFTLGFDTSTGMIQLIGPGSEDFYGLITGFSAPVSGLIDMTASWGTLPADAQTFLNSSSGLSTGFVIYLTDSGTPTSVDFTVVAPEPASLLLLCAGILALGLMLKRKAGVLA